MQRVKEDSSILQQYCCPRILRSGYPDWGFSVLFPQW